MATVKHLLPPVKQYFKANLHTHSTISDGELSPQEVKDVYKAKGYQILSLTDHQINIDHSNMNDPDFLMLTGTEYYCSKPHPLPGHGVQTYHLNFIAKRPDNLWTPTKPSSNYPNSFPYFSPENYEEMDVGCDPESINALIARANEMGFLVMYNHPTWSCQSYPDYAPLKGLWGMELRNSECCFLGYSENNFRVFSDLLNLGNKIFPLGTDDMHHPIAIGHSWIMVGAQALRYDCVIDALEKGDFYMSCGPQIHSLTVEGNTLKITCSDVRQILLETHSRYNKYANAPEKGSVCEASFDLSPIIEKSKGFDGAYFRLTIVGADGSYAATRAYYLYEI